VSRWLQQQILPKYPDLALFDVLLAYGMQRSASACQSWMAQNGLTHPVLRDKAGTGSIASTYSMGLSDLMIMNRDLKIVFKARVTDTLAMNKVLSTLGQLP
jgi:hypothetical protein